MVPGVVCVECGGFLGWAGDYKSEAGSIFFSSGFDAAVIRSRFFSIAKISGFDYLPNL
jgi:hypothetical protein